MTNPTQVFQPIPSCGLTDQALSMDQTYNITTSTDKHYSLDSEDDFCSGCQNVSHQQQFFSEVHSPGRSQITNKHARNHDVFALKSTLKKHWFCLHPHTPYFSYLLDYEVLLNGLQVFLVNIMCAMIG